MDAGNVIFNFKGDTKDIDKKTSELGPKLGNIGKSIGGAFLKGTAVATTAITGLVATSVKGFSDIEQLSGGAKKIFDEIDYSKIEKDAVSAYKSMNMSAQEYLTAMNNVGATFASTMGDQKGYDTAKKGLQAISDYATGTGADINLLSEKYKMITRSTSSYLSIADQFAGLLPQTTDGFLKQAQASGYLSQSYQKLTDVPVEEYQQAITNMLEQGVNKMGLLGNTSAEATKTISGSFLATKSALSNFISGVGGVDEVTESFTNLSKNVIKAINKMSPKLVNGLVKIGSAIANEIPSMINSLLPVIFTGALTLINGIGQVLPQIVQAIGQVLPQIINKLVEMAPIILQQIINIIPVIATALANNLPTLIPVLVQGIISLMQVFNDNMPLFLKAGVQIIVGIAQGLINSIPLIFQNLGTIIEFIINFFSVTKLIGAGKTLLTGLGRGLINAIPNLISNLPQIISKMVNVFKTSGVNGFKNVGSMLIKGLWSGIKNMGQWCINKIKGLGKSILKSVKDIFGVHSPSREFAWIGEMNMQGLYNGMKDMQPKVQQAIDGMFDLSPSLYGSTSTNLSPVINVTNINNIKQDPLGQMVNDIKTFAGGSKNDYNYGMGV